MLAAQVRSGARDLTLRQLALLAAIYENDTPPTIRGLAADLALSKPVVSRAVDSLEKLGLCRRRPDPDDRRSVVIQKTVRGSVFVDQLIASVADAAG